MGSRANLIVVKGGDWKLYYDHLCALRLDLELFWGPELATQFIEQAPPVDDRTHWLDEIWCQGAALIDHDRKILLWFGGEDLPHEILLRREFLQLMQRQWPDWTIRWATGGIVEIGAYLGMEARTFLAPPEVLEAPGIKVGTGYPDSDRMLLTVRENNVHTAARVVGNRGSILVGSKQLQTLRSIDTSSLIRWSGSHPTAGLHLDIDGRAIHFWLASPSVEMAARVQAAWPGWETFWLEDQFEDQLELSAAEIHLPLRTAVELQREILKGMRHQCHVSTDAFTIYPVTEFAEKQTEPWGKRNSVGSLAHKLHILDDLETGILIRSGCI